MTIQQAKELAQLKQTNPSLWQKIASGLSSGMDNVFNWNEPRNINPILDIMKGEAKDLYSDVKNFDNYGGLGLSLLGYGPKYFNQEQQLYNEYDSKHLRDLDENFNAQLNPNYHSSAFGEAKGANFNNYYGGLFGPTPDYVPDLVDAMVAAPQRLGATVGIGAYQGLSELYKGGKKAIGDNFSLSDIPNIFKSVPGSLNKAFRDTEEEMRGYIAARYNRENVDSAADAWRIGQSVDDATHSNIESVADKAYRFGAGPVYDTVQSAKKFLSNNNPLTNIFNQGRIDVNKRDAFTGKQLADSLAMDAQLAYNQVPNYPTGPGKVISVSDNEPTIIPPAAPVVPTYNPPQGPAGYTRPTRSPAQQAAQVNRKAKSMGVASPIRRTPGTKYGFGL
jgi:hypothetical protein